MRSRIINHRLSLWINRSRTFRKRWKAFKISL